MTASRAAAAIALTVFAASAVAACQQQGSPGYCPSGQSQVFVPGAGRQCAPDPCPAGQVLVPGSGGQLECKR